MKSSILILGLLFSHYSFGESPTWLTDTSKHCTPFELCAVGEATGKMMAEVSARDEIAKIFETKIKSENEVIKTAYSKTDKDGVLSGEINEDVRSKINETTELTLKGVIIKEHFEDEESHYALAVLHKRKAAAMMEREIESLSDKNNEFFKDGRRSSLNKIIKNMAIMEMLNARHEFLVGSMIKSPLSLAQVMQKKRLKRKENLHVALEVAEVKKSKELEHLIKQKLVDNDYVVVKNASSKDAHYKVFGEMVSEKQYFNVKGFVKIKYILKITATNKLGKSVGALEYTSMQTGRSSMQAYANAIPGIRRFISENLNELSMD